jgi:hypothetical protein
VNTNITPGTWARVGLRPDCPGDGSRPHHPAEEDCRVEVRVTDRHKTGDHHVFALCKGGGSYRDQGVPAAWASAATSVPTSWSRSTRREDRRVLLPIRSARLAV